MDYGFLDIGRDKANQLLCLFLLKNGLDSGGFCMGKVGDVQCNIESWNASRILQPSSGSWVFCKIDDCISSWVLYLTFKQFLLPKCIPQSLALAFHWVSPAVAHASLTSSIAFELRWFSPRSLLSMLEVTRTSHCGHSGRQTLLPWDLGWVFKTAWCVVSQGKLIKHQSFLKMGLCVNV